MGKSKTGSSGDGARDAAPALSLEALVQRGMALHRQGRLAAAEGAYSEALAQAPDHVDATQLLGTLHFQLGRFASAAELLRRAVDMAPAEAGLWSNLGLALQQLGRPDEALACQDRALALQPHFAEAHNNRGSTLRDLNRLAEAAACFQRALEIRPDFAEALYNLGGVQLALGHAKPALQNLVRYLQAHPLRHEAMGQCGVALLRLKQPGEALAFLERAVELQPRGAEALFWRGNALHTLGRAEAAVASYRQALQVQPDIAELHYNLANALLDLERREEAIAALEQALALRPDYVEAHYNLGSALQEMGRHAEAAAAYTRLEALAPGHRYTPGKLFHCRQFCCDWTRHATDTEAIVQALAAGKGVDMPLPFLAVSQSAELQLRCARAYTDFKYPAVAPPLWNGERYRHERIRIAYVSADLRDHAVAYLLAGVFEAHDRQRFETVAIALRPREETSAMGRRVAAAFERFIDVSRMGDAEVAALMRELEVDIAIDLTGYTQDNRTDIFARRPAPIQVNYLGFPGSMGAPYMDYLLADAFVVPPTARPHYTEQVAYLPHCFQANDDRREIAERTPSRAEAGLPETGFVFCAFNNVYKFNPAMFDVWMRLLDAVPGSVLWLATDAARVRENLSAEATRRGVDPARLVFSPRLPYADHLARMRLADLFLDTLPFNAGTTASDALWAGLPVLTCAGEAFAARMAGSLLHAVGLPELVTHDLDAYEALALRLAREPELLAGIRARLGENRSTSPLFDTRRFCRDIEAAYVAMWRRYQDGAPPGDLGMATRVGAQAVT